MQKNDFLEIVKPYTMTSVERINELFDSLEYIRLNKIDRILYSFLKFLIV